MEQIISQATLIRAYEKQTCSKKTVVRLKVEYAKTPPPRRITVEINFNDGTSRKAEAILVSAYSDYAYYDLSAADAREVYPYVNNIREIKIIGE
jgi:uncharacterized surface anchored protein